MAAVIESGRTGLVVERDDPRAWADSLRPLVADGTARAAMGRAARAYAETRLPSWDDVLARDLLPVWRAAAGIDQSCSRRAS